MGRAFKPIEYSDGCIILVDQTKLPVAYEELRCTTLEQLWQAIKQLSVRGAPLLGITAAYGVCLALDTSEYDSIETLQKCVRDAADYIATSRPTAVNLFWALERMKKTLKNASEDTVASLVKRLKAEAIAIHEEDVSLCKNIGLHGAEIIDPGDGVLTHCNAGGLATSGFGTALAVIFTAHDQGKNISVYADETRPLLQGSRLTAWELREYGVPATILCDNMAGVLMREGRIQKIVVGADRIAANGDSANKIGTYSVAVLAKHHKIPFYIAAPYSTVDFSCPTGADIVIEERDPAEVIYGFQKQTGPVGVPVFNPAFDVTPHELIAGIITEKGVLRKPYNQSLSTLRAE